MQGALCDMKIRCPEGRSNIDGPWVEQGRRHNNTLSCVLSCRNNNIHAWFSHSAAFCFLLILCRLSYLGILLTCAWLGHSFRGFRRWIVMSAWSAQKSQFLLHTWKYSKLRLSVYLYYYLEICCFVQIRQLQNQTRYLGTPELPLPLRWYL